MFDKLRNIAFAIWLIVAFPAMLKIAFALAEEGWQLWKQLLRQLFRSKGPDSQVRTHPPMGGSILIMTSVYPACTSLRVSGVFVFFV